MDRLRRYSYVYELQEPLCKEIIHTLFANEFRENVLDDVIRFIVDHAQHGQLEQIDAILDKYQRQTCSVQTTITDYFESKPIDHKKSVKTKYI
eukprot:331098_1